MAYSFGRHLLSSAGLAGLAELAELAGLAGLAGLVGLGLAGARSIVFVRSGGSQALGALYL